MKIKRGVVMGILAVLMLSSIVSAFGVSAPYWETNPLSMVQGETKTVDLNLQNMVGNEDVTVKAIIKQGSDIASLSQDTYVVKAGTSNMTAPLQITISANTTVGTQKVIVEFKTVPEGAGMVTMGTGMTVSFDVIVNKPEKKINVGLWSLIAAIIIVLVIIGIVLARKKK